MAKPTPNTANEVTKEMIDGWKKQFPGGVYEYTTEDGKKGYFRAADRKILGLSTTAPDAMASNDMLAKNCWLGGDREIIDDDKYFFGLSNFLPELINKVSGNLTRL